MSALCPSLQFKQQEHFNNISFGQSNKTQFLVKSYISLELYNPTLQHHELISAEVLKHHPGLSTTKTRQIVRPCFKLPGLRISGKGFTCVWSQMKLACLIHSNSIRICQRCSRSHTASRVYFWGIHAPGKKKRHQITWVNSVKWPPRLFQQWWSTWRRSHPVVRSTHSSLLWLEQLEQMQDLTYSGRQTFQKNLNYHSSHLVWGKGHLSEPGSPSLKRFTRLRFYLKITPWWPIFLWCMKKRIPSQISLKKTWQQFLVKKHFQQKKCFISLFLQKRTREYGANWGLQEPH